MKPTKKEIEDRMLRDLNDFMKDFGIEEITFGKTHKIKRSQEEKAEDIVCWNKMKNLLSGLLYDYGWIIMEFGNGQKWGSPADIYAESMDGTYFMIIDDGNCGDGPFDTIYHIYCGNLDGKVFEGRPKDARDVETLMRMLGFEK